MHLRLVHVGGKALAAILVAMLLLGCQSSIPLEQLTAHTTRCELIERFGAPNGTFEGDSMLSWHFGAPERGIEHVIVARFPSHRAKPLRRIWRERQEEGYVRFFDVSHHLIAIFHEDGRLAEYRLVPLRRSGSYRSMLWVGDEPNVVQGVTSRRDLLLRWGEPDGVFDDERTFVYRWVSRGHSVLRFAPTPSGTDGESWSNGHALVIQFDEDGLVVGRELKTQSWQVNRAQGRYVGFPDVP